MQIEYRKTERKYWSNGYSIRGNGYKDYAFSFYFGGVLISWRGRRILSILFFWFIN